MELARNRDGAASPHRKPQEAALTAPAPGPLHWRRCDRASGLLGSGTRHPGGLASAVRIPVLWTPRAPPETPSLGSCRVGLVTSNGTVWGLGSGQDKQRHPLDPPSHLAPGAIASKAGPNPGRYDDPRTSSFTNPHAPPPFSRYTPPSHPSGSGRHSMCERWTRDIHHPSSPTTDERYFGIPRPRPRPRLLHGPGAKYPPPP